jgi:K+-sensing histidine kinase KdpD
MTPPTAVQPARSRPGSSPTTAPSECPLIDPALAHTLAHDLRSPLTVINLSAELLCSTRDQERQQRYAQAISEQARAISWALENLLTLADDDVWRSASVVDVDLRVVAERCIEEMRGAADARGISVDLAPGAAAVVEGAADALHQALRGCLQAVVMAAPTAGSVIVEFVEDDWDDEGRIAVRIASRGDGVSAPLPLPWHRLSLRAACHLITCHRGSLSADANMAGVTVRLPRRSALSERAAA